MHLYKCILTHIIHISINAKPRFFDNVRFVHAFETVKGYATASISKLLKKGIAVSAEPDALDILKAKNVNITG